MSQIIQRSVGPGTTGAPSVIDNVGQAAVGGTVTVPAGYMGPLDWGTSLPMPVGPMGAYGWQSGFPPPVGPPGTAGWVGGLPGQARGTTAATPTANTVTTPVISPTSVQGSVTYAVGVSGLPVPPPEVIAVARGSYASPSVGSIGAGG